MIEKLIKILVVLLSVFALASCDEDDTKKGKVEPVPNDPNDYTYDWRELPPFDKIFKSESYGDGDVVTFDWTQTLAWFLKSDDYKYGFDMDPYAIFDDGEAPLRGSDVYVSVKRNELANVKIRIDPKTKKMYHLHKVDENGEIVEEDVVSAKDICLKEDCIDEVSLPAGDYAVYYDDMDVERYLHIIPYTLDPPREIIYVQFGDDDAPGCIKDGKNGCYTKKKVEEKFNEIMRQAVVEGRFIEKKPSDIGLDNPILVDVSSAYDMNDLNSTPNWDLIFDYINSTDEFGYGKEERIYSTSVDDYNGCLKKGTKDCSTEERLYLTAESNYSIKYDKIKYNHIVLAINQMRVQWSFEGGQNVFNNYAAFKKALEYEKRNDLEMTLDESSCGGGERTVRVSAKNIDENLNVFTAAISGVTRLKNGCAYTIYADVHPFSPDAADRIVQFNHGYLEKRTTSLSSRQKVVSGGIVWGGHTEGKVSLNVIVHEIGHSFGLSDLYIADDDPTFALNYVEKDIFGYNPAKYKFAVDESNLMGWAHPAGQRLRYRPLLVSRTGAGEKITYNGAFVTEKQWDCLRSYQKCNHIEY